MTWLVVIHAGGEPLFTVGEADRGDGLEGIAEAGNPEAGRDVLAEWVERALDGSWPQREGIELWDGKAGQRALAALLPWLGL